MRVKIVDTETNQEHEFDSTVVRIFMFLTGEERLAMENAIKENQQAPRFLIGAPAKHDQTEVAVALELWKNKLEAESADGIIGRAGFTGHAPRIIISEN